MTFDQIGLAEPILRAVTAEGYSTPTPIQAAAIPAAMTGRDLLGCAQTGTGKTAAFALPILHRLLTTEPPAPLVGRDRRPQRRIRCLILSPTRELAIQIGDSLRAYGCHTGLRHTVIVGGVGQSPQVHALQRGVDILVATPGRLVDLRQQGYIDLRAIEIFVLDEADRMLDMGFLPEVKRIVAMVPEQKQTLFFSATMPKEIAELAEGLLHHPEEIRIAPVKLTTDLVTQWVCHIPKPSKPRLLATMLKTQPISRAIVFTRTKHGADRLAHQLEKVGIAALALHGDKSQSARQRALAHFKSSHPPILVATDVAARGIDVDGISHVFNFDLPNEPETYVHRIGRTGRAGASGQSISFCDDSEKGDLRAIEKHLKKTIPVHEKVELAEFPTSEPNSRPAEGGQREQGPRDAGRRDQGRNDQGRGSQAPRGQDRPRRFDDRRPDNRQPAGQSARNDRRPGEVRQEGQRPDDRRPGGERRPGNNRGNGGRNPREPGRSDRGSRPSGAPSSTRRY
jgi:ATP-dependent RNA helicase RhlE